MIILITPRTRQFPLTWHQTSATGSRPGVPRIRFDQVDEKCSHIVIVLLEMHAVYEVARENLAHLPHESIVT